jgi:predicted nucleotidyltransferase
MDLLFWVEYVLESEKNAARFFKEQRIDLSKLVKKAISAFEAEAKEVLTRPRKGSPPF